MMALFGDRLLNTYLQRLEWTGKRLNTESQLQAAQAEALRSVIQAFRNLEEGHHVAGLIFVHDEIARVLAEFHRYLPCTQPKNREEHP